MSDDPTTYEADAFTELVLETFRFNGQLIAAGDRLTKEFGISSALWQVLGPIDQEPLPVAQIARNMGLTRQSVRRTARVLEKKGLVEFRDNPNHKRARLVALTERGRDVLDSVTQVHAAWAQEASKGLSVAELNQAVRTMKTLGERL